MRTFSTPYGRVLAARNELHYALLAADCPDEPIRIAMKAIDECEHQVLNAGAALDEIELNHLRKRLEEIEPEGEGV